MIEVVSAVIIRGGRILLTQRKELQDFGFSWECPGGKVDGGESHHQALRREIVEEIGVGIFEVGNTPIWSCRFSGLVTRPERSEIFLLMYLATLTLKNEPRPCEGQGIGWFTGEEMRKLTLAPGNQGALEEIVRRIR